jgi:ribulose-bisphosphate carboxylase large chain
MKPTLSGDRLRVRYRLDAADAAAAAAMARELCIEQTVEFPADLLPDGPIREQIVGRVEQLVAREAGEGGAWQAVVSYAVETVGDELTQLLNVLYGNTSLKRCARVEQLDLPEALLRRFRGPRFGRAGLRAATGEAAHPLLCTALKPMGLDARQLAGLARRFALGGIHLIKDDHGLADQPFCPFEERAARCAEAVAEANAATGGHSRYVPNVTAPAHLLRERAARARELGAGGLLVAPGLVGWDAMRRLADDALALPIIAHPALLGSFLVEERQGFTASALLGQLVRLAGGDAVIYPHAGGRFPLGERACRELARATAAPMGGLRASFPVPAGGINVARVPELCRFYGPDVIFLIGGDLHRGGGGGGGGDRLVDSCRRFGDLVRSAFA